MTRSKTDHQGLSTNFPTISYAQDTDDDATVLNVADDPPIADAVLPVTASLSIRQVLRRKPDAHFLVGGTGDPRMVQAFMADDELAGRVTFLHRNVNLAAYAHAIDVFVDTFPMIGGLACREIVAQGVPVLSLRSNEWGLKQDQDRDPQSIADDEPALIDLICRTLTDVAFREARAAAAAATIDVISDVATSAAEIDAAMMGALRAAHKRS